MPSSGTAGATGTTCSAACASCSPPATRAPSRWNTKKGRSTASKARSISTRKCWRRCRRRRWRSEAGELVWIQPVAVVDGIIPSRMQPTNVGNPDYYHRVVDCQWACPAHTNVPEYIRLIAQGRFTDAYMLNRESNVFPGILGRTCDRPCEPACRRTRVDGKPVAICRLKRVAADHRDEVRHLLPTAPAKKNGKKVALIGAGPASLTVANDLMPLGYQVTIFEKLSKPGGLMRINIPAFRLPEQVLDEEIGYVVDMGVDVRYNTPVESLKALLDSKEYDAVFVGSGAPKGKELEIPGRHDTDQIFIGIEWLESVHFGHVDSVGKRVLIIGVGNTAMDCCRSAKRLGATD